MVETVFTATIVTEIVTALSVGVKDHKFLSVQKTSLETFLCLLTILNPSIDVDWDNLIMSDLLKENQPTLTDTIKIIRTKISSFKDSAVPH